MSGGERPIGAAKGKQSDTEALCQPPPFVLFKRVPIQFRPGAFHGFPSTLAGGPPHEELVCMWSLTTFQGWMPEHCTVHQQADLTSVCP